MTTAEIESLLEQVRSATGPDRDIDGAIEVQARRFQAYAVGLNDETRAKWQHNGPTVFDGDTGYDAERFTVSVDSCLALIERVLPGCEYEITNLYKVAMVSLPLNTGMVMDTQTVSRGDCNVPLALLEALLLALLHQASKGMINAD